MLAIISTLPSRLFLAFAVWTCLPAMAQAESPIRLPVEVFGPSGSSQQVVLDIADPTQITHLYLRCNACAYHDQRLDNDPNKIKATVSINGRNPISLKHYTGSGRLVGNPDISIIGPEKSYGGLGGGFRTVRFTLPVDGLQQGLNVLTFTHAEAVAPSIGFRIIELNLLENESLDRRVLSDRDFIEDDPALWTAPLSNSGAVSQGQKLWSQRNLLNDPLVDALKGENGGVIRASCADCHASDGRDLAYFNFSNESIIARSVFHGLSQPEGRRIASYIRSLGIPVVDGARPWNPPYQPGPGLDSKPAYQWAAGAGLNAVLDQDSDMHDALFPDGIRLRQVKAVVDRKATLNMRELPIAIALPDWNQWLPPVHPDDALDLQSTAVRSDAEGNVFDSPYYDRLYRQALAQPSAARLGAMVADLRDWSSQDALCYSAGPGDKIAAPLRALDGAIWGRSLAFEAPRLDDCAQGREDYDAIYPVELAKQGLLGWTSVKMWEIIHGRNLERRAAVLPPIQYQGQTIPVAEARGWQVDSQTVFNRAPHFLSHNSRHFVSQDKTVGAYDTSAWYHLNLILNPGYRQTMPSHFIYTINYLQNLHSLSGESQSYRFWATMIKMRQLQTNGRYGVEEGLDLRTAQPHFYFSDVKGDSSLRSNVNGNLWRHLMTALLDDFVADVRDGTASDWAAAKNNSRVQARGSRDFSEIPADGPMFEQGAYQGKNTYKLIPLLRAEGVRDATVDRLIEWGEQTWPNGPWARVR